MSTEYIVCDTELLFRCAKNHQWVTKAKTIKKGRLRPTCGHEKIKEPLRDSIEKYQEIAKNKGGYLISDKYENIN